MVQARSGRPPLLSARDWRAIPNVLEWDYRPWSAPFAFNNAYFYMYYDYANNHLPNPHPLANLGWMDGSLCRNGQFIPPVKQQIQFPGTNGGVLDYDDTPRTSGVQTEVNVSSTVARTSVQPPDINKGAINHDDTLRTSGLQPEAHVPTTAVNKKVINEGVLNYDDTPQKSGPQTEPHVPSTGANKRVIKLYNDIETLLEEAEAQQVASDPSKKIWGHYPGPFSTAKTSLQSDQSGSNPTKSQKLSDVSDQKTREDEQPPKATGPTETRLQFRLPKKPESSARAPIKV